MNITQQFNPVRLVIGKDSIKALPTEIKQFGNKCLVIVQDNNEAMMKIKDKVVSLLDSEHIEYDIFRDVRPNPLLSDIKKGIKMIQETEYNAIVAIGGGSVIDSAKLLSLSNKMNIDWEKEFSSRTMIKNVNKLPLLCVPTTAGTGSHCTQAAIISDDQNQKHSLYSFDFFSSVAFIDYTLTMSLPNTLTASTGFDAFCHLSESYIMGMLSPIYKVMNVDAMKKIASVLPSLLKENKPEYREIMSIADSCAGISLSNGGAIIPHAFGEAISSHVYRINHGCSLAIVYPSFIEHYFDDELYGEKIKDVVEIINYDSIVVENGKQARKIMEQFLDMLSIPYNLSAYEISQEELEKIKNSLCNQKRFPVESVFSIIEDICTLG